LIRVDFLRNRNGDFKEGEIFMKYKFMAWDWDAGEFVFIPTNDFVEAIYWAWNYEFDVYNAETKDEILVRYDSNDVNSELMEPYGYRLIDHDGYRNLQSIETGEIFKPDWE
jgi:hypothetical protein